MTLFVSDLDIRIWDFLKFIWFHMDQTGVNYEARRAEDPVI
jgi:hypothetical protein